VPAYRVPFSRADVTHDFDMVYPPLATPEMQWEWLTRTEHGLSETALHTVQHSDHRQWPSGSVLYFVSSGTWRMTVAEELAGREDLLAEVQGLFGVVPEKCRVSFDKGMNGRGS